MEKIKNLSAFRIVTFAVAIAIILGFASLMVSFTASADTTNDISTSTDYDKDITFGTLKNYSCFQLGYSSEIDYLHLRNLYYASSSPYMFYTLFGVDSSDNLVALTSFKGSKYTYNNYTGYQLANITDGYYYEKLYKFKFGFSVPLSDSSISFNSFRSNFDSEEFYAYATYKSFDKSLYSKFYLVYTGSSDNSKESLNSFVSDISNNINGSEFKNTSDSSPSAEFTNFKGTEEAEPYLFFVDWFDTGNRLPLADFRIDDNANYHSYSLRISTNKQYIETLKSAWAEQEVKEAISLSQSIIGNICIPLNHSQLLGRVSQLLIIKKVGTFSYNVERNISSDLMRFDENSNVNSKGISICLSDYITIIPYCIYKLEIVDNNTSLILDTVYFNSENGYSKGNSGYGTKVNDYESKSELDDDLKNNNGFTGGTSSTGDVMDIDDPADITDMGNIKAYGDLDITSIFDSLQSSSRSLGLFFQTCMAIIPTGILAVIIGGLSIVIILRILGR